MGALFFPPGVSTAGLLGGAVWIAKISAERILHVLAAVQQPHIEKSHHCGDEVGVSDLPGAPPVMAAVPAFFLMILMEGFAIVLSRRCGFRKNRFAHCQGRWDGRGRSTRRRRAAGSR